MSSYPFNILNTSIKSPLSLLVSTVVNPNFLILFHTLILKNHFITLVALFCTLSNMSVICMQYSNLGQINDLYN